MESFQNYKNTGNYDTINNDNNAEMEACYDHFYKLFHKNFEDEDLSDQQKEIIKKVDIILILFK